MKITKNQVAQANLIQLRKAITLNFDQADDHSAVGNIGMAASYQMDAEDLSAIHDIALKELQSDASTGSRALRDAVIDLDTAVRDEVPSELCAWIFDEPEAGFVGGSY